MTKSELLSMIPSLFNELKDCFEPIKTTPESINKKLEEGQPLTAIEVVTEMEQYPDEFEPEEDFSDIQNIAEDMTPEQAYTELNKTVEEHKSQDDYYTNEEDKTPVTEKYIQDSFGTETQVKDESALLNRGIDKVLDNNAEKLKQAKEMEFIDLALTNLLSNMGDTLKIKKENKWIEGEIVNGTSSYIDYKGETVNYKVVFEKIDGEELQNGRYISLHKFKKLYKDRLERYFQDLGRIHTIVVRDEQVIINGVNYAPMLEKKYLDKLPLDLADYVRNGSLAQVFDWVWLKETHITVLDIDSPRLYVTNVADSLGVSRTIKLDTMFKCLPSLKVFTLGKETLTREETDGGAEEHKSTIKKKSRVLESLKHFTNYSDGYKINPYSLSNGLHNYTMANLKSYSSNRGNRGLLRYTGGTLLRAALTVPTYALNLGFHLIGGVFNVAKAFCKGVEDGYKSVNIEDMKN